MQTGLSPTTPQLTHFLSQLLPAAVNRILFKSSQALMQQKQRE